MFWGAAGRLKSEDQHSGGRVCGTDRKGFLAKEALTKKTLAPAGTADEAEHGNDQRGKRAKQDRRGRKFRKDKRRKKSDSRRHSTFLKTRKVG